MNGRLWRLWLVGFLFATAATWFGLSAVAQEGPDVSTTVPRVQTPTVTFKMERNASPPGGQEFIRFLSVLAVHTTPANVGSGTDVSPAFGQVYQRVSSIDRVAFDHSSTLAAIETCRVYLTNGAWYVVAGSVDEVWERVAEAGGYGVKPARGERE